MATKAPLQRLNKRQINYYLRRVYALLRSDRINIIIKRMKKNRGLTDLSNVWLDPDDRILPTIIHECLHIIYPRKTERDILNLEKKIAKRISEQQLKKLLLLLAEATKKSKQKTSVKPALKEFLP